jgi:hypothetical protein
MMPRNTTLLHTDRSFGVPPSSFKNPGRHNYPKKPLRKTRPVTTSEPMDLDITDEDQFTNFIVPDADSPSDEEYSDHSTAPPSQVSDTNEDIDMNNIVGDIDMNNIVGDNDTDSQTSKRPNLRGSNRVDYTKYFPPASLRTYVEDSEDESEDAKDYLEDESGDEDEIMPTIPAKRSTTKSRVERQVRNHTQLQGPSRTPKRPSRDRPPSFTSRTEQTSRHQRRSSSNASNLQSSAHKIFNKPSVMARKSTQQNSEEDIIHVAPRRRPREEQSPIPWSTITGADSPGPGSDPSPRRSSKKMSATRQGRQYKSPLHHNRKAQIAESGVRIFERPKKRVRIHVIESDSEDDDSPLPELPKGRARGDSRVSSSSKPMTAPTPGANKRTKRGHDNTSNESSFKTPPSHTDHPQSLDAHQLGHPSNPHATRSLPPPHLDRLMDNGYTDVPSPASLPSGLPASQPKHYSPISMNQSTEKKNVDMAGDVPESSNHHSRPPSENHRGSSVGYTSEMPETHHHGHQNNITGATREPVVKSEPDANDQYTHAVEGGTSNTVRGSNALPRANSHHASDEHIRQSPSQNEKDSDQDHRMRLDSVLDHHRVPYPARVSPDIRHEYVQLRPSSVAGLTQAQAAPPPSQYEYTQHPQASAGPSGLPHARFDAHFRGANSPAPYRPSVPRYITQPPSGLPSSFPAHHTQMQTPTQYQSPAHFQSPADPHHQTQDLYAAHHQISQMTAHIQAQANDIHHLRTQLAQLEDRVIHMHQERMEGYRVRDEEILGLRRELAQERRRGLGFPSSNPHGFHSGLGNWVTGKPEMADGRESAGRGGEMRDERSWLAGYGQPGRREFGVDGAGRGAEAGEEAGRSGPMNQRSGRRSLAERYGQVCIGRLGEGNAEAEGDAHAHAQEANPAALPNRKGKGRARDESTAHHYTDAKDTVVDDTINADFPHGMNDEVSEGSDNPEHWEGYKSNLHAYGGHHSSITKALKRSRRGEYESLNR